MPIDEQARPYLPYSGHHVCNHLISIEGDEGNGEVYALAYHILPGAGGSGQYIEDLMGVRYIDNYRRCSDGNGVSRSALSPSTYSSSGSTTASLQITATRTQAKKFSGNHCSGAAPAASVDLNSAVAFPAGREGTAWAR